MMHRARSISRGVLAQTLNSSKAQVFLLPLLPRSFSHSKFTFSVNCSRAAATARSDPEHPHKEEICNLLLLAKNENGGEKIREYIEKFSGREIQAVVGDISSLYYNQKPPEDQSLSLLVEELRSECLKRLKSYNVTEDKFISQNNDNLEDVLRFCHHWTRIEEPKRRRSVVTQIVNNIGDTDRRTSVQRFKHFTKDSFVLFCKLMRHVNIFQNFHRYYVLVKFMDLFDQMNEEEVTEVCSTIAHHSLHLSSDHPLALMIKTNLMDFLEQNIHVIEPKSLLKICVAFSPTVEYQLPREMIPRIINFQKRIFEENLHTRFNVKVLLYILNLTNNSLMTTRAGLSKDLLDVLVERIVRDPSSAHSLTSKDIASLSFSVSKHRDTPAARLAVLTLVPRLRNLLADHATSNYKNVIFTALQLAHTGIYDLDLLEELFSCPLVSIQTETGVKISPGLKYSSRNITGGFFKTGGDLLHLQGMMEVECPEYRGKRITEDLEMNLKLMLGQTPLQLRDATAEEERRYLSGYYVSSQLDLHDVLSSVFGPAQVSVVQGCRM